MALAELSSSLPSLTDPLVAGVVFTAVLAAGVGLLAAGRRLTLSVSSVGGSGGEPPSTVGSPPDPDLGADTPGEPIRAERQYDETPQRIREKTGHYPRALELRHPTGFINTDSISIGEYVGQRVILIEFWTFGCYNCQNSHPKIQSFWRQYRDDGLLVIGVHYPEFDRERKPANVEAYVTDTDTTYPVILDNNGGTWEAYDQRYWPARYLVDIDGFIRYFHAGEGAYEETNRAIKQLLSERTRVVAQQSGG